MKRFVATFIYASIFWTGVSASASCAEALRFQISKTINSLRSIEQLKAKKAKERHKYEKLTEQLGVSEDKDETNFFIEEIHRHQLRYADLHNQIVERQGGFKVTPMKIDYIGEQFVKSRYVRERLPVIYYSDEKLKERKISFRNGKAFYANGKPVVAVFSVEYIMDEIGDIYILDNEIIPNRVLIRHTTLSNGHPVAAAGLVTFEANGRLSVIHRRSGHYMPDKDSLKQFTERLQSFGMDLSDTFVEWEIRPY